MGLIAHLAASWSSELDYTWSSNSLEYEGATFDTTALSSAFASGTVNPFGDTIAYPLNLGRFVVPFSYGDRSTLNDVNLRASGPVGSMPGGDGVLTVGLEHRKEGYDNSNSAVDYPLTPENDSNLLFYGQSQLTNSIYAEALLPLVGPRNAFPGMRSLDLQLAGRSERYTVFEQTAYSNLDASGGLAPGNPPQGVHGTTRYTSTNPTAAIKYQPIQDFILRGSFSKAFLPPTAYQLLPTPLPSCCTLITDPHTGQTYNVQTISGGNSNLSPQTSRDWELGLIFEAQEEFLQGLRIDLEHFEIVQPNYITSPQAQQIVSDPAFASRVARDPATGRITTVNTSYLNAILYRTDGWDLKVNYQRPSEWGTWDAQFMGTMIEHDLRQYGIRSTALEYVGFPADGGEAKIKATGTLAWEYRHWKLGWSVSYIGSYRQYLSPGSPFDIQYFNGAPFTYYTAAQGGFTVPSQIYHDFFASYTFPGQAGGRVGRALAHLTIQFGLKNVFNKLPPFDAGPLSAPYYYSPYGDPRLRDYRTHHLKGILR